MAGRISPTTPIVQEFLRLSPRPRRVGRTRSRTLPFFLQEITVSTRCIYAGIRHSMWMRGRSPRRKKMRVFIADDSAVIVERLADLLKEIPGVELAGHASNATEAVRCIRQIKPDAVILDFQMPGGSGLDVLRAIGPDHPGLHVLICTNYPYPQYREECLGAGANFFLDKSSEFEKIPAILRGLTGNFAKSAAVSR